jgi:hypothetical protein
MSADQQARFQPERGSDALIDEVRAIRREICQQFGNDVGRLVEHLREVESDCAARRGVFGVVSKEAAERVMAGWGEEALRTDDPLVDVVREIRKRLAHEEPRD